MTPGRRPGLGILLGLVNNTSITYQFQRNGSVLPQGAPQDRAFTSREYEAFVSDTWRVSRDLTVTMGLRYSNDRPPYEANGLQVSPTIGLNQFFAERNYLQKSGCAGQRHAQRAPQLRAERTCQWQRSWYGADNNNFGPRLALAYSPSNPTAHPQKAFGANGVFRAGGGMVYDRFGSELITQFDQFGSFGFRPRWAIRFRTTSRLHRATTACAGARCPRRLAAFPIRLLTSPPSWASSREFRRT